MNFKLYVHISPKGKRYYGITKQEVKVRWKNGSHYEGNDHFLRAIKKYGWNNFKHEILFNNLTEEEAKLLEQMYIVLYNTNNPEYGYNQTLGGDGCLGYEHTEEHKAKLKEQYKGEGNPFYGKHHSQETLDYWKETRKKGEEHHRYGTKQSEEAKEKNRKAHEIKVICIETNKIFDSLTKAGESIGVSRHAIRQAIKRNGKSGGYHWEYYEEVV